MDEITKARAIELIAAGVPQRAAAAELGISRAMLRRMTGAPGVDAEGGCRPGGRTDRRPPSQSRVDAVVSGYGESGRATSRACR